MDMFQLFVWLCTYFHIRRNHHTTSPQTEEWLWAPLRKKKQKNIKFNHSKAQLHKSEILRDIMV